MNEHALRLPPALVRFVVVGGIATAIQYALLAVLVGTAGMAPVPSSAVAFALSALCNYLANHSYTFRSQRAHESALPRFAAMAAIGLGVNTIVFALALELLALHYLVAQEMATVLTLSWNYIASRRWVFVE